MNNLDEARDRVLRENTAQTVFKYLEDLENNRPEYGSRWIWELVQNARDAAGQNLPSVVEASLSAESFVFRHSGQPFREEEIAHLIYYGSSKHDPESSDPIGKFGSGFLTTHLLAKSVSVKGTMHDGRQFNFVLERVGSSPHDLANAMDRSWDAFKTSLSTREEVRAFSTEYTYPLSNEASVIATAGLGELQKLGPYTLAFNPKLREIRLVRFGKEVRFAIPEGAQRRELDAGIVLIPIQSCDERGATDHFVAIAADPEVAVAVLTASQVGGSLTVVLDESSPRLFVAFPLFGTESFCFPATINSELLQVREKRDGIYLGADVTDKILHNKSLIERATDLYIRLLNVSGKEGWIGTQRLALLPEFRSFPWIDEKWYRELLSNRVIESARDVAIIVTNDGSVTSSKKSRIPIGEPGVSVDDIWAISDRIKKIRTSLPSRADAAGWSLTLERWASVLSRVPQDLDESWTLEKIATEVADIGSTIKLKEGLVEGTEPIEWLNALYRLLASAQRLTLFDDLPLLPNQTGVLKTRNAVYIDSGVDDALKDIAAKLKIEARELLLDRRVDIASVPKLSEKREEELVTQLLQAVGANAETLGGSSVYREANVALFNWLLQGRKVNELEGFPCLSLRADGAEGIHVIRITSTLEEGESVPLAPTDLWPEEARKFAELFPDRFIISSEYWSARKDLEGWKELEERRDFVRLDPAFDTQEEGIGLLPSMAFPEADPAVSHRITGEVSFSGIAFFSTKNVGVIDRARGSQNRARQLLHFLVEYVLARSTDPFEELKLPCECGDTHSYYRGEWLRPLKERNWVPIGDKQHATATAESLTKLLGGELMFLRELAQGKAGKILEALKIGRSDLLLRSSTNSEAERIDLVASVLDLSEAVGNDPAKLKAIAAAIAGDPEVLTDIETAAARRALVRANQAVGREVENLLRELLEAPSVGLKVTRKPFGQDFEVENDVIEGLNQEVGFEVSGRDFSFLVEVKASTRDEFRMTPKQAETSVAEVDRFVLCAVRLVRGQPITKDGVRLGCRFVPRIGQQLKDLWGDLSLLETLKQATSKKVGDIELEIDDSKARFKVGKETWESGSTFDRAIESFRSGKFPNVSVKK